MVLNGKIIAKSKNAPDELPAFRLVIKMAENDLSAVGSDRNRILSRPWLTMGGWHVTPQSTAMASCAAAR